MRLSWKLLASVIAVAFLVAACGGGTTSTTGKVAGTLTRAASTAPASLEVASAPEPADIVPGQFLMAFERGRPEVQLSADSASVSLAAAEGFSFRADGGFSFGGIEFEQLRAYPTRSGLAFYEAAGLDEAATRDLVEDLRGTASVRSVFPNWILTQLAVPNDTFYADQAWHYGQMNLPAAWDIETGILPVEPIYVAVLDSGAFSHSDIDWAPVGANFVDWRLGAPAASEGPITNPWTNVNGSDHGTHVAGTIAARTNNGLGVAGVNWGVRPIPVKVLGANGSGSIAGIIEGLYWAAGDQHPAFGGYFNPTPARVANLSLGANFAEACDAELNSIFEELYEVYGMISVVAAGNDASPTDVIFPASCDAVITVGATGPTGARAYYSNFGPYVDVFAPGGDAMYSHPEYSPADDIPAGVLSTIDPAWGSYDFYQGTSMAAPHVTGLISLMLSQDPTLTREQIRERLHNASMPLSETECNVPVVGYEGLDMCGAGLLDAEAALLGKNVTADDLGAVVYAVPYKGAEAPEIRFGDLGSLATLAGYSTAATKGSGGAWSYELSGLAPGKYLIVGVEMRNPGGGVGMLDRFGVQDVTVSAGKTSTANLVATPVWMLR